MSCGKKNTSIILSFHRRNFVILLWHRFPNLFRHATRARETMVSSTAVIRSLPSLGLGRFFFFFFNEGPYLVHHLLTRITAPAIFTLTSEINSPLFILFQNNMADSSATEKKRRSFEFDDIFEHVSSFGKYQKILYFCTLLFVFPVTNQFSLLVFGFGTPKFQCVTPNVTCEARKCCDGCHAYEFMGPLQSTVSEVKLFSGDEGRG